MYKQLMAPYVSALAPIETAVQSIMQLRQPIRAVVFDIYGTLFISGSGDISIAGKNSEPGTYLSTLLKKYNVSVSPDRLQSLLFHAIETAHMTKKAEGHTFPEVVIQDIWAHLLQTDDRETARRFAVEYEMIVNPVYPMPHLRESLQYLQEKSIPMGIISNAQFFTPYLFDLFLDAPPEHLGFDPDLTFYSFAYGMAKPSPYLFDMAAAQLSKKGIAPGNVLYVGNDMLNDIYPSHKAGFQTCLFAGDKRSLRLREDIPECRFTVPDAIIKDLNQLKNMIPSD